MSKVTRRPDERRLAEGMCKTARDRRLCDCYQGLVMADRG